MLGVFTGPLQAFRSRAPQLLGPERERVDACGFCGSRKALWLSRADYWDLAEVSLVRCTDCGLLQLDPMLKGDVAARGCLALYRHQQSGETAKSRRRGLYRAFRRGVAFAVELKRKGVEPTRVLEVGAGDGYFLKGLQYVFPRAEFTCVDVVAEILDAMRTQHGFKTIQSAVEDLNPAVVGRYDLVVARDILEHVTLPGKVLETISHVVSPGGYFFFITPNGWQDAWQMFSRWKMDQVPSEILINHVNYFDPVSLRRKVEALGMKIQDWYIYDLKTFWRGAGWRLIERHKAQRSAKRSAKQVIDATKNLTSSFAAVVERSIPSAYRISFLRPILMFYCWFKHTSFVRVDPSTRIGEEIYCFAQKGTA